KSHVRCHAAREHVCDFCPARFARNHDLRRHERSLHNTLKPHVCPECGRSFARSDAVSSIGERWEGG
ncbi:hypothetical protein BDK51DRAFT_16037, partial [Blyttiomyces helicus]